VQMILNYLSTRDDLDMDRVGMFGQGSGGTIAALAASVDARIKAVNLLGAWGDWSNWVAKSKLIPEDERPDYMSANFLSELTDLDPVHILPDLKMPVHLQDVLYETDTPASSKARLEAAMPGHDNVTRYSTKEQFAEELVDGKLLAWIKHQLRASVANKQLDSLSTQKGDN